MSIMKRFKSIFITNNKGGVGKTLLSYCLGMVLANEHNKKVLFIDVDVQGSIGTILGMDVIDRPECLNVPDIFKEMKMRDNVPTERYIRKTTNDNVDVILNDDRIMDIPDEIVSMVGREKFLMKWLKKHEEYLNNYDVVFFDSDSSMKHISANICLAVDSIVFIASGDKESLAGLQRYFEQFTLFIEDYPEKEEVIKGILVNDLDETTNMGKDFLRYVKGDNYKYRSLVLESVIHRAEAINRVKVFKRMFTERENKRAFTELRQAVTELAEMGVF